MKLQKTFIFLYIFCVISSSQALWAIHNEESFAYKLALLHERDQNFELTLTQKAQEPESAHVMEFQWLLDTIKARSLNPEMTIADTIYLTWQKLRQNGGNLNLLETARELTRNAKNTQLFGKEKVNFRVTSELWLISQIRNIDIQTLLKMK